MIQTIQNVLLAAIVASCWLGCAGMLRMREPTQAMQYLSLPAGVGGVLLPAAFLCVSGWSVATLKAALVTVLLLAANSIVTHATVRAIRVRKIGHWEPREGDRIEFIQENRSQ
ncbi:MAG TPA: monovalent cation/H(+) antiporter subunit G [Terracidiphilus sp.]